MSKKLDMKLTLIIRKGEDGFFIGQLKEIPAVISQGSSEEGLFENIQEALELYLEDMREEFHEDENTSEVEEKEMIFVSASN